MRLNLSIISVVAIKFERLEEIARALKPIHQSGKSFHVTFVYKGNKMICVAHNDYNKIHPHHRFGKYKPTKNNFADYQAGIHSECAALIKLGLFDCSYLTFVNLRINNRNQSSLSKPCKNCQNLLDRVGYKAIWFKNKDGIYEKTK